MKASAPGKLVISGAYAVLRGAPALVAAVDRAVTADTTRAATFQAPEVLEGLPLFNLEEAQLPFFDASDLREEDRKLGLGSSAGICVASLAALIAERMTSRGTRPEADKLAEQIFPRALAAHRRAQGGGSGVDVAAACFGGVIEAHLPTGSGSDLEVAPLELPAGLVIETWASPIAATTSSFVRKVLSCEQSAPSLFQQRMGAQITAAEEARDAARAGDATAFIAALRAQLVALSALGQMAHAPIVLPEIAELHDMLHPNSCFLPSGAGGGDVTLYSGPLPSSAAFRARATALGLTPVPLKLGAPGLQLYDS